jgi:hypothetical protein
MGLLERFLRREDEAGAGPAEPLVLNPNIERPLKSFQVLFPRPLALAGLTSERLTRALRAYHPWLAEARCQIENEHTEPNAPFGLAGWDDHVVKLVGTSSPLPPALTMRCVRPAHYVADMKTKALVHQANVELYYAGHATSPLEQYVALAVVAGVLATHGAEVVLNENARTSLPAEVLAAAHFGGDRLELLRALPLPTLYIGFVKYEVAGTKGVWMRTHGGQLMGLPDLAYLAKGHDQGELVFDLFSCVLHYCLTAGAELGAGHTMQLGRELFLRARTPVESERFLECEGTLLVLETISALEINS